MFDTVAPVEQEGEHISYTADQVSGIQASIEKNLDKMLSKTVNGTEFVTATVETTSTTTEDNIPF